jgi:hypothetical protein
MSAQKDDPDGVINMKVRNPFIAALGPEVQYYLALVRSLDSSLGDMLEGLAISIAQLSYQVSREVARLSTPRNPCRLRSHE